jgi:hypothetical protein
VANKSEKSLQKAAAGRAGAKNLSSLDSPDVSSFSGWALPADERYQLAGDYVVWDRLRCPQRLPPVSAAHQQP